MQERCPACRTPVLPVARFCHACGAPIAGVRPRTVARRRLLWIALVSVWLAWASWVACWVLFFALAQWRHRDASALAAWSMAAFSLLAVLSGLLCGYPGPVLLGWFNFAAATFAAILDEIDSDASGIMAVGYAVITLPLAWWATRRRPVYAHPWLCRRCGYLLYGLQGPTCPECGLPFDPAKIMGKLPPGEQH